MSGSGELRKKTSQPPNLVDIVADAVATIRQPKMQNMDEDCISRLFTLALTCALTLTWIKNALTFQAEERNKSRREAKASERGADQEYGKITPTMQRGDRRRAALTEMLSEEARKNEGMAARQELAPEGKR